MIANICQLGLYGTSTTQGGHIDGRSTAPVCFDALVLKTVEVLRLLTYNHTEELKMNDFRNTIRINDSVINLDERLVICKSGPIKIRTQLRNILEELVLYSPDSVSIQDLTYYLEIKAKESIRRAILISSIQF